MNEWVVEIGTFIVQVFIVVAVIGIGILLIARAKSDGDRDLTLQVEPLHERRRRRARRLKLAATPAGIRKKLLKTFRKEDKHRSKQTSAAETPNVWVLTFKGDMKASATEHFAQEISALIEVAKPDDEVVICLESPGGLVHAYGLAAAQLDRLRDAGLTTTVCVDKVAASGGYLMACTAHHIKAAPFAVIGSIGVVAQVPNIHRLLKRNDIDVEMLTAGKYKRTLTVLGENTEEGRDKFLEDLENTHRLFKQYVGERRPDMDIDALATGEIWYGSEAVARKLVDSVGTSEAYLMERIAQTHVYRVKLEPPKTMGRKFGLAAASGVENAVLKGLSMLEASGWHRR
ncbi:protease SohB [Halomonas sp. CUBES01]|uniref:Protease SohB n=1 Tax=Vreelandella gomseomensis TaxID=370766 RepID=A0ABU1GCJ6_9GAMM|nr:MULTISPECIES: protease SohB [Halomonas]MDR5874823.1 protease SohB [Halomonas gomseomensis]MEC4767372.1 protease SohB [Halomonas sp. CUBES01]